MNGDNWRVVCQVNSQRAVVDGLWRALRKKKRESHPRQSEGEEFHSSSADTMYITLASLKIISNLAYDSRASGEIIPQLYSNRQLGLVFALFSVFPTDVHLFVRLFSFLLKNLNIAMDYFEAM